MHWIKKQKNFPKSTDKYYICLCHYETDFVSHCLIGIRSKQWMEKTRDKKKETWTHYMRIPKLPKD